LVERNTYKSYTMDDVPPIPNFIIVFPKGKFMGCVRTTTYARTQTLDWGSRLFGVLHVDATHVKNSWECHGSHVSISMSSHGMWQTIGAYCGRVTKGQMIRKYSN